MLEVASGFPPQAFHSTEASGAARAGTGQSSSLFTRITNRLEASSAVWLSDGSGPQSRYRPAVAGRWEGGREVGSEKGLI